MITIIEAIAKLGGLLGSLLDWWHARRSERLGRLEQESEQGRADDEAVRKAAVARRDAERVAADSGRLREDDGFRRD